MEDLVLTTLDAIENHLNTLVTTLTASSTLSAGPAIAQSLLVDDNSLTIALAQLKRHQDNYKRILELQAEAAKLDEQIKDVVRNCGDLRREVRDIDKFILQELDEEYSAPEIDLKTLLSFSSRISKHNAAASREANADAIRRKLEARPRREHSPGRRNGTNDLDDPKEPNIPEATRNDLAMLDQAVAAERAAKGMAFPNAENLRKGDLGHLQMLRETSGGEDKVDQVIEELLRSEASGGDRTVDQISLDESAPKAPVSLLPAPTTIREQSTRMRRESMNQQPSQSGPQASAPPKPISLALYDEEDSE